MERITPIANSRDTEFYQNVGLATGVGSFVGFCLGGRIGARAAGSDHILSNQLTTYKYKMQAHREYHSAVLEGFVKNGSRWGWRAGVFAGLYSGAMTLMAEYRDKHDGLNFLVAGAATGATYKMLSGFRGILVGTILGAFFSLPIAAISQAVIWAVPDDLKEKINHIQREQKEIKYQIKPEPWQKNMEITGVMIAKMEDDLNDTTHQAEPT